MWAGGRRTVTMLLQEPTSFTGTSFTYDSISVIFTNEMVIACHTHHEELWTAIIPPLVALCSSDCFTNDITDRSVEGNPITGQSHSWK